MLTRITLPAALSLCLATVASAQTVWIVDDDATPGTQFQDIAPAIAVASDGDTVLVRAGVYGGFSVSGKSLAIVADTATPPTIDGTITIDQLAFPQQALVRGLKSGKVEAEGLRVVGNLGAVRVEDCILVGGYGYNNYSNPSNSQPNGFRGAHVESSANVAFTRCTIRGGHGANISDWSELQGQGGAGLFAELAKVACYDVTVEGGGGGSDVGGIAASGDLGGAGGDFQSSQLFASGSSFKGGSGGHGGSDWTWGGCGSGGDGGTGLKAKNSLLFHLGSSFVGGPAGYGVSYYGCSDGTPGASMSGNGNVETPFLRAARSFEGPAFLRALQTAQLTFDGEPGDTALVLTSFTTGAHALFTSAAGVLLTHTNPTVLFIGAVNPAGDLLIPVTAGNLPAGIDSVRVQAQAAFGDSQGVVTLGANSELVILRLGL